MLLTEELAHRCQSALTKPVYFEIAKRLQRLGFGETECRRIVRLVDEHPESYKVIVDLKIVMNEVAPELTAGNQLERYLLINAASGIINRIVDYPLAESVRRLYLEEFAFFASPGSEVLEMFEVGTYRFAEMCKVASLRRFPAGQLHWEISGVVRSSLRRVSPLALPKVIDFLVRRLNGYRPCFCGHLNGRRRNSCLLLEFEQKLAYYRMAKSMEFQSGILGYVCTSWIHSAATANASPHLEWLNSILLENGALLVDMGPESPDCGALVGSPHRRELWERGEFRPRSAMVIWPRSAMLKWAAGHTELEEDSLRPTAVDTAKQEPECLSGAVNQEMQAMIGFISNSIVRNPKVSLDIDTPLISSGLVDSFAVLEMLQQLERITRRRISPADVSPGELDTVAVMFKTAERFPTNGNSLH